MLRTVFLSLALMTSIPMASAGHNQIESAEALVSTAAEDISQTENSQVADAVLEHIDTRAIANFTLGRHGRTIPAADKARFVAAFEDFLRRQIETNVDQFKGIEVEVVDTAARNARDAIVTTELHGGAAVPLKVRWRVIERKGAWSVVDLEVAGIWLAIEQRAQVASILSRPGADIDDVIAQFG